MNKIGTATSEAIIMMYRIFLVMVVAMSVFFVVALYYDFYVDSLNSEAIVLNRAVVRCLSDDLVDLHELNDFNYTLLDYCGIEDGGDERLYVWVDIGGDIYEHGDSGTRVIREMFDAGAGPARVYRPGFSSGKCQVQVGNELRWMEVKTYVKSEEK
jgi:hypothetical protein